MNTLTIPRELNIVETTWDISGFATWQSITIVVVVVAGIVGSPLISVLAFSIARRKMMARVACGLIAGVIACAWVTAGAYAFSLVTSEQEGQHHSLRYLEVTGTTMSISVTDTYGPDGNPSRLGIRLQEHPHLLLEVRGSDVDRFIGTEGVFATLSCDPDDLNAAVVLNCSATPPTPADAVMFPGTEAPNDDSTLVTTRTPVVFR